MTAIRIYGKKGMIECKPFQVNTADDEPEAIAEENSIFNYSASDTDESEFTDVGEQTGN